MTRMQRNLDGIYFRVQRDGKWQNVCFSDLELDERAEIISEHLAHQTPEQRVTWLKSLANALADRLYDIGEQLGVMCE